MNPRLPAPRYEAMSEAGPDQPVNLGNTVPVSSKNNYSSQNTKDSSVHGQSVPRRKDDLKSNAILTSQASKDPPKK